MRHVEAKRLHRETQNIPEGEIFVAYDERAINKSIYVYTPTEFEHVFCFSVKIKGSVYSSDWVSEKAPKAKILDAMRQVMFIKRGGWFNTGEKRFDDLGLHREALFRCCYCGNETVDPKGECVCRRVAA